MKIGVIAGGGDLPVHVFNGARQAGHSVLVAQLDGHGSPDRFSPSTRTFALGSFGAMTKWLKREGVTHVSLAGQVDRPDFAALKPDLKAVKHLPRVIAAARKGDDALLQALMTAFEGEGFTIIPPQDLAAHILAPVGQIGAHSPTAYRDDIIKACETARRMGALDIGQGAIVADGIVLAVEAQEGTSNMIRRVGRLPQGLKGQPGARKGVLAKILKPGQDSRIDLPTIGLETIDIADRAGLAGIVVEGGRAFIIDREDCVTRANAAGLFLLGLPPA